MEEGAVITPGRYYQLVNGEIGLVGFKLRVGGGFIGMTNDGSKMSRWWNDQGVDNRDKDFNIVKEVKNPYDSQEDKV
jgi:hypothetical protein